MAIVLLSLAVAVMYATVGVLYLTLDNWIAGPIWLVGAIIWVVAAYFHWCAHKIRSQS
jgi:hypothetical protein